MIIIEQIEIQSFSFCFPEFNVCITDSTIIEPTNSINFHVLNLKYFSPLEVYSRNDQRMNKYFKIHGDTFYTHCTFSLPIFILKKKNESDQVLIINILYVHTLNTILLRPCKATHEILISNYFLLFF